MLSRDAKIFETESAVRARMIEYGTLFEELHIIVFTKRKAQSEKCKITISKNVFVYSTNSTGKLFYIFDAIKISKKILSNVSGQMSNVVITSQDPFETGYAALRISKKLHIPLQIQIHTDFASPYFKKESFKNFIRYIVSKIVLPKADCVRVVSKRICDSLESSVKCQMSNVSILPIWTDAQKIKNAEPIALPQKFCFTVLWVGRLEKEKNCALAIDVLARLVRDIPGAGLVIIGDGSRREALKKQVARNKLQEKVLLLGWKDDIAGYYKSADVLLATSWYEGYGMNMVEAKIAGIPVVAPDIGVAREVGAYITKHTAESIAETLVRLYEGTLPKRKEYEYPYKDKETYMRLYTHSFEICLQKDKKI